MADVKISNLPASTTPLAGTEVLPIVQGGQTRQVSVNNLTTGKAVSALSVTTTGNISSTGGTVGIAQPTFGSAVSGTTLSYPEVHIRPNSGYAGAISFTENAVADRWAIGVISLNSNLLFSSGRNITSATVRMALSAAGALGIGGATPSASGAGITFPATQSASSDANTLDDYEEGTWSFNVEAGTGALNTVTGSVGRYTKVGRLVTLFGQTTITDNGTGSNYLGFFGVPFTANASFSGFSGCATNLSTGESIMAVIQAGNVFLRSYDASYPVASGESVAVTVTYQV